MKSIAVTDTHALIWYAEERWKKLGSSARAFFHEVDAGRAAIYIPALVMVELLEADRKEAIRLHRGGVDWLEALLRGGNFFEAPLTAAIVREAQGLYGIPERVDRPIAATALHLGVPLITRDPEIATDGDVDLIW